MTRRLLSVLALLALAACTDAQPAAEAPAPARVGAIDRSVAMGASCWGCESLPADRPGLARAAKEGLPASLRAQAERRLGARHDALARLSLERGVKPPVARSEYTRLAAEAADAAYRAEAARRLAGTSGAEARPAQLRSSAAPAAMAADTEFEPLCVDVRDERVVLPPIEVGCGSIDCCPNCPLPDKLDWRIRVRGGEVLDLMLEAPAATRLQQGGFRKRGEVLATRVPPRGGMVRGLPTARGRSVVALTPVLRLSPRTRSDVLVEIDQMLGNTVVNTTRSLIQVKDCHTSTKDHVRVKGSADRYVLMFDAALDNVCHDDTVMRGRRMTVFEGNMGLRTDCRSELSVFAGDAAMELIPDVTAWTPAIGDRLEVEMKEPVTVPVTLWLTTEHAKRRYEIATWMLDTIFWANKTGIRFGYDVRDISSDSPEHVALRALIGSDCPDPHSPSPVDTAAWAPGRFNIYFTEAKKGDTWACFGKPFGYVGSGPYLDSLAWLAGYHFSLDDLDSKYEDYGLSANNVMSVHDAPGELYGHLTLGQVFRMNTHPHSALNTQGWRRGPTRMCPDHQTDAACPGITVDWFRAP